MHPLAIPGIDGSFFDLAHALQLVVNGLTNGSIYALVALTVVIVYRTTGHLNFAQGEMGTMGAFVVFALAVKGGLPYWIAIPIVLLGSMLVGALVQRLVVGPVERRGGLDVVLVTLGLYLIFNSLDAATWGTDPVSAVKPFPNGASDQIILMTGPPQLAIPYSSIGTWACLAVIASVLWLIFQRTQLGLAYRAVAANPDSAVLVGIPRGRMLMFGWALAAAIGSIAAVLFSNQLGSLDFNLMVNVLLYGLAAAALGGFDSTKGAVVGGLIVGLAEALVPSLFTFIGSQLSLVMALVVIVVVLLVRPQGLFGSTRVERV